MAQRYKATKSRIPLRRKRVEFSVRKKGCKKKTKISFLARRLR